MSLAELETVVESLSEAEQDELLRHLEARRQRRNVPKPPSAQEWMQRLDALRASLDTGRCTVSGEQIIDELRED